MDVYLAATCRFLLGCASGLSCLVNMFGRPSALVNTAPMSAAYSMGVHDLAIPQRVVAADGRTLSFEEILSSEVGNLRLTEEFERRGIGMIRNSPEEIAELTVEMLERLDGTARYGADDEDRQARFRALFHQGHYAYKAGSRIGREFLRRYS
jgi:putative glycosyltransferase (TIGR04372 family)